MKYSSLSYLTPKLNQKIKEAKSRDSNSIQYQSKPRIDTPLTYSTIFQTQIRRYYKTPLMKFPKKKTLTSSHNSPLYLQKLIKKRSQIIKSDIDSSCSQITSQNQRLSALINANPYVSFSFKDYLKSKGTIDITMNSIKTEIKSLGKEIDKKGLFLTISNRKSNANDSKSFSKIFVSQVKNNIYSRSKQAERLHPLSVLKFRKRFQKEFHLEHKQVKPPVKPNAHLKFIQAYNREVQFKKRIDEQYSIKGNDNVHYISSFSFE